MSVQYSNEKVFGQSGDLIRAKRDRNGDVVLYVDAIALDYADPQQGIKEYLNCFTRYSEDQPRDEDGKWTDGGGDSGGDSSGGGSSGSIPHEAAGLPTVGAKVDGLTVDDHIPNTGSIDSTFASENDYTVLTGVREVPFSAFGSGGGKPSFYSASEKARVEALAEQIKESGNIQPLIVVYEQHNLKEGPYVLEGGHRFDALRLLEKTKFPALVVVDHVTGKGKSNAKAMRSRRLR